MNQLTLTFKTFNQISATLATVAIAVAIAFGFWVLGTPQRQRLQAADEQRVEDLHAIALNLHWNARSTLNRGQAVELPASLPPDIRRTDPITEQPYEYQRLDDTTYELCAEFATNSAADPLQRQDENEFWLHPSGEHCFEFNVLEQPPPRFGG